VARDIDAPYGTWTSFHAKRLSLVEYVEKNGINKEIRREDRNQRQVANNWLMPWPPSAARKALVSRPIAPCVA
jgi:hypothetical protein